MAALTYGPEVGHEKSARMGGVVKQVITAMARSFRDVRRFRSDLAAVLEKRGVGETVSIDVQLVASELVTYGLVHASAPVVSVRAIVHDDRVELLIQHSELADVDRQGTSSAWFDAARSTSIVQRIGSDVVSDSDRGMRTTTVVVERAATTRLRRERRAGPGSTPPLSKWTGVERRRSP